MFIKFQIILKIAASTFCSVKAEKFLSFKMDPLPICIIHRQGKDQDFREQFFTSKSDLAAPVSGESYLITTRFYLSFTH